MSAGRGSDKDAAVSESAYAAFYRVIASIPRGRVASYGQVAALAGRPGRARQVGYALAALKSGSDLPWHRVVNAEGRISERARAESVPLQRVLLEAEGVRFDSGDRVLLDQYRWSPAGRTIGRSSARGNSDGRKC